MKPRVSDQPLGPVHGAAEHTAWRPQAAKWHCWQPFGLDDWVYQQEACRPTAPWPDSRGSRRPSTPHDLDTLDQILEEWSVSDVKRVLGELRYRLELIARLESLVDEAHADELHDLQPLFERGLWMFGPEFESISFISNRTLAKVVETFFDSAALATPRKRPDFVVLPDSSIGVYSCDSFDARHEVSGYATVVVVELKKGGFEVGHGEKDQALRYARELRRSGKVGQSTRMVCYVLGARVDPQAEEPTNEGETTVSPRAYSVVLRQAHARTFNLLQRIESAKKWQSHDEDLNAVLEEGELPLFGKA